MCGDKLLHAEAHRPPGKDNGTINAGFRAWLIATFAAYQVEHVAAEEPLVTNLKDKTGKPIVTMATYRRIYGLFGVLEELCATRNIPFETVHQSQWRKAFLRNGRGKDAKEAALAQCRLLGWDVKSKDVADSIGVCWWLGGHLRAHRGHLPNELFTGERDVA
jgi:hypothetical protein